jgi:hypothetical protein
VELFGEDIPGIDDTQERELFASTIEHILKVDTPPDNAPSYRQALQDDSINGALDAQIEINRFVGSWSGEGVAVGPFGFTYEGSPEGPNLVRGADPTPHLFALVNSTNKALEFDVSSKVFADTGDWADSSSIRRTIGGAEINRVRLNSKVSVTLVVMIAAPDKAVEGEAATIQLTAETGPPTSRSTTYERSDLFLVATETGEPTSGVVTIADYSFTGLTGPVDITDLEPEETVTLSAFVLFEVADTETADFALDVLVQSTPHDEWGFYQKDTPDALPGGTTANSYTLALPGLIGRNTQNAAALRILTPASGSVTKTIDFRLRVRSTSLDDEISMTHDDLISLTVEAGG